MLTLKDRLSDLTYKQACKLLGPQGAALLQAGGNRTLDLDEHVRFTGRELQVTLASPR